MQQKAQATDENVENILDQGEGILSSLKELERAIRLKKKSNATLAKMVEKLEKDNRNK